MATLVLRPRSDKSLSHSSTTQNGCSSINESVSDGDSTYIYQSVNSTSSQSIVSSFNLGSVDIAGDIVSATLVVVARSTSSNDTAKIRAKVYNNSKSDILALTNVSSQYIEYTETLDDVISDLSNGLTVDIETQGKLGSSKNSRFQIRVTQVYVQIEYNEKTTASSPLYVKDGVEWVQVEKVYQKSNGTWVESTNYSTLFNNNSIYERSKS